MLRFILFGLIFGAASVLAQDDPATLPEMPHRGAAVAIPADPPRQFDFWLGRWDVRNKRLEDAGWGDAGNAEALIQSVADGHAVLEQWTGVLGGNPLIGFSLRALDPELGKWVTWLNWHGGRPGGFSPMQGSYSERDGGRIELFPPNDDTAVRYTFSMPHEDSCQWDEARSKDGGKNWRTRWIMQFTRKADPLPADASNAPIVEPPASAAAFPETRALDFLIGAWHGTGRVRDGEGWRGVRTRARVTSMIEGFGLLQYVDTDDGVKTMAALGIDKTAKAWVALQVLPDGQGIRRLTGSPWKQAVTFVAEDRREGWNCSSRDACTYRRESSADGGKSWTLDLEATLNRSAGTAAFIDMPRAREPFADVLTAGQPSEEQLQEAARSGYRTIVNLRGPGEDGEIPNEAEVVEALGMRYVSIPITGGDGINVANAELLAEALAGDGALPAIVHCASSNRVGGLFAVKAHAIDGAPLDEALAVGRGAGLRGGLETRVREQLSGQSGDSGD